jgi:hypothetical protein
VIRKGKWRGAERKNMKMERGKIQRSLAGCRDIVVLVLVLDLDCIFLLLLCSMACLERIQKWEVEKKNLPTPLTGPGGQRRRGRDSACVYEPPSPPAPRSHMHTGTSVIATQPGTRSTTLMYLTVYDKPDDQDGRVLTLSVVIKNTLDQRKENWWVPYPETREPL